MKVRNIILGFFTFIALCSCGYCTQCNMNTCMTDCDRTCNGGGGIECLDKCQSKCVQFYGPLSEEKK